MALPGKFGALTCDMGKRGQRGRSGKTKRPEAGSAGLAGLDDGIELKRRLYSTCNMIHRGLHTFTIMSIIFLARWLSG